MESKLIRFNEKEVDALKKLIDLTVKAVGISVAEPCLYFFDKINGEGELPDCPECPPCPCNQVSEEPSCLEDVMIQELEEGKNKK